MVLTVCITVGQQHSRGMERCLQGRDWVFSSWFGSDWGYGLMHGRVHRNPLFVLSLFPPTLDSRPPVWDSSFMYKCFSSFHFLPLPTQQVCSEEAALFSPYYITFTHAKEPHEETLMAVG